MGLTAWIYVGIALFVVGIVSFIVTPIQYLLMSKFDALAPSVIDDAQARASWTAFSTMIKPEFSIIITLAGCVLIAYGFLHSAHIEGESYEY